jgi:hypothetical protein
MSITNKKPITEGIDKITVLLQPYLIGFLNKELIYKSPETDGETWYNTGKNEIRLFVKNTDKGYFPHLIIYAKYTNPLTVVIDIMVNALIDLIDYGTIDLKIYPRHDSPKSKTVFDIPRIQIRRIKHFISYYIFCFIHSIKDLEIFFDVASTSIAMKDSVNIFNSSDIHFKTKLNTFQASKDYKKEKALVQVNGKIYSKDYHYQNGSATIKIYNHKEKQIESQSSYREEDIKNYPYDVRISYLLTSSNTGNKINILNTFFDTHEFIGQYLKYLIILTTKYLTGSISFRDIDHLKYLPLIYNEALLMPRKINLKNDLGIENSNDDITHEYFIRFINFIRHLKEEYDRLENNYISKNFLIGKLLDKNYTFPIEFFTPFGIYNSKTDDIYNGFSIDEEYAPFGGYLLTPFGFVKNPL